MGKPYLGPIGAGAVAFEPAAAIGSVEAQGFLAVSHHHPDAGIADPLDGGDGVGGVGDDVAGADDLLRGQAQGAGPGQHGVRGLDVGIGAVEAQHRTVDGPEVEHWSQPGGRIGGLTGGQPRGLTGRHSGLHDAPPRTQNLAQWGWLS